MEKLARGFLLEIHQVLGQAVVAYLEAISSDGQLGGSNRGHRTKHAT